MEKGVDYVGVSVVFFCHDGKGNYLFNKRSKNCRDEHGRWDPGGGSMEFDLSVEENLRKEVEEEYCTTVEEYEFLGFRDMFREDPDGRKTHWIGLDFKVLVDPAEVENGEPHKFDEIGWFKMDELPEPMHSQFHVALEKYKDKLV